MTFGSWFSSDKMRVSTTVLLVLAWVAYFFVDDVAHPFTLVLFSLITIVLVVGSIVGYKNYRKNEGLLP